MLPKALKSCPMCKKSPNLVTLFTDSGIALGVCVCEKLFRYLLGMKLDVCLFEK